MAVIQLRQDPILVRNSEEGKRALDALYDIRNECVRAGWDKHDCQYTRYIFDRAVAGMPK